jgi:hypothetical protein
MQPFSSPIVDDRFCDLQVIDAVVNILDQFALPNWDSASKLFTTEHVENFYYTVQNAWPRHSDVSQVVPTPSSAFRVLYVGDKPSKSLMLRDIARMSLYADQILVVDAFDKPFDSMRDQDPAAYRFSTFQNMRFLKGLAPWVRSGIVRIFPNPFEVNPDAGAEFSGIVKKALVEQERVSPNTTRKFKQRVNEWLSSLAGRGDQVLDSRTNLRFDEVQSYAAQNPQRLKSFMEARIGPGREFDESYNGEEVQVMRIKGDVNLKELLFISELSRAHPLSINRPSIQDDVQELARTIPVSPWDPFARALASIDLPFLDNVDPSFALELRKSNRLEGFRRALKDTWDKMEATDNESEASQEFKDRLQQAKQEAEAEWLNIKSDAAKWAGTSATAVGAAAATAVVGAKAAGLGVAITAGALAATGPAVGLLLGAISYYVAQRYKRESYTKSRAMSVLVDLAVKG